MSLTRRSFLAGTIALPFRAGVGEAQEPARSQMGLVLYSYSLRRSLDPASRFDDPEIFLEHCAKIGAGGAQTSLGIRDDAQARRLRARLEKSRLYLEGIVRLPQEKADVERFSAEVRSAQRCGASVLRTTLMSGRRYEVFKAMEDFRRFLTQARRALLLAQPVVERHKVKLAVENHKDLRAAELLDMLQRIKSPALGVCLDTGNNIALLESPMETVAALAPLAFTVHLKDMGVEEYGDGFLLSEVALGGGFLALPRIVEDLRKAQPGIRFNLEMITRDPLRIPCLTQPYWTTLEGLSGRVLAQTLAMVRRNAAKTPLARISSLSREDKIKREEENVQRSLQYARTRLRL